VAAGEDLPLVVDPGQPPQHRRLPQRLAEDLQVPAAADPVGDHPGQVQRRIERGEAAGEGRETARHPGGVGDQDDRSPQPLGDLRRRPLLARRRGAVEQPHHPLDDRDVPLGAEALGEGVQDRLPPHQPAVQVVAGPAGGAPVVGRVQVVGPALEDRDLQPAGPQGPDQPDGDGRLADPARHPGNHQPHQ
jgi:hypothetical protein